MEEEESLVKIPQMQYADKVVDVPVVQTVQTVQDPTVQFLDKIVDMLVVEPFGIAQMQCVEEVVDVPVVQTVQVPHSQIVEKLIKIPQLEIVEQIVVFPEIPKIQTVHGTQTSESLGNSLVTPIPGESQAPQVVVDCVQTALVVAPGKRKKKHKDVVKIPQEHRCFCSNVFPCCDLLQ